MMSTPERSEEQSRKCRRSSAPECAAFAAFGKFELREDVPFSLGRRVNRSEDGSAPLEKGKGADGRSAVTRQEGRGESAPPRCAPRKKCPAPPGAPRVPALPPPRRKVTLPLVRAECALT